MTRIAMLSLHACPLARLGSKESGGMNVYVRELSQQLGTVGYEVDVYSRRTSLSDAPLVQMADNVRVIRLDAGEVAPLDKNEVYALVPEMAAKIEALRVAEGISYDLVHSHYWLSAAVGIQLAELWRVPHITMFHTLGAVKNHFASDEVESQQRVAAERQIIAATDSIVVSSDDELGYLRNLYDADLSCVSVIPCGVNLDLFQPHPRHVARTNLGMPADGFQVLFVGRMDPLKGLDILLQAAAVLAAELPLRLTVVGGDAAPAGEELRVRRLAESLGLGGLTRFEGAVGQTRLPLYYSAADVCVMPSYYESFGLVAVESLACGTPVIASAVGGLTKIIRHGENGLLIAERTPVAFAAGIRQLHNQPQLRLSLAQRARDSIAHLSWSAIAGEVGDLYQTLLERHAATESARLIIQRAGSAA